MAEDNMKLSDLPPELLRGILNGPQSCGAVITLWKAGDRILNAKLVNNGVTDVDLVDDRRDSSSRWPQCLKSFRLGRLSISCRNPSFCTPDILHELQQLSPALKVLQLYFPGVEALLPVEDQYNDLSHSHDDQPPAPKRSQTAPNDAHHTAMWDIGQTWPSLEQLALGRNSLRNVYGNQGESELGSRALMLLPRGLTYLSLPWSRIHPLPGMLPPGLKTLHVSPYSLGDDDLHHLPKSLTDIMLSVDDKGLALLNQERDLLPNLKQFPIIDLDFINMEVGEYFSESLETLSWPPNMLELICYASDDDAVFEELPSAMTSLTVISHDETPILRPSVIHCLPRGLTYLSIVQLEWTNIDVSTWPSTLIDFAILDGTIFNADHFCLLPRNLKTFSIQYCERLEGAEAEIDLNPLPPHRFEALFSLGRESLSTDTHWTSIKRLIQTKNSSVHGMTAETYISSIESGQLYGLPLTLTSLSLPEEFQPLQKSLLLPPRLSYLQRIGIAEEESPELILAPL